MSEEKDAQVQAVQAELDWTKQRLASAEKKLRRAKRRLRARERVLDEKHESALVAWQAYVRLASRVIDASEATSFKRAGKAVVDIAESLGGGELPRIRSVTCVKRDGCSSDKAV